MKRQYKGWTIIKTGSASKGEWGWSNEYTGVRNEKRQDKPNKWVCNKLKDLKLFIDNTER